MSQLSIKNAFETAIAAMTPTLDTAYANADHTPVTGTPFQKVFFLPATPDNTEQGVTNYREQGLVQVDLCYPLNEGELSALTRAELLRNTFKKGTTLTQDGITINVTTTPVIFAGSKDNDRWVIPVRITYLADIHL